MRKSEISELDRMAYIDGELTGERRLEVETRLADDPVAAARMMDDLARRTALGLCLSRTPPPPSRRLAGFLKSNPLARLPRLRRLASPLALSVIALSLTGAAAPAPPPPAQMARSVQDRLLVQTAPLAAAQHAPSALGYARVLDAGPLALLDADLSAAVAAAAASQAEAARATTLHAEDQMVAAKVAEAAVAAARADQTRVRLLRTRLGLEWGPAIATQSDGQRAGLIRALAAGDAALVRIDSVAATAATAAAGGVTLDLGAAGSARVRILGPARTADPRFQSGGQLGLVTGRQARGLGVGLAVPVDIQAGGALTGVIVPESAVLRAEGQSWVFVRTDIGAFERRVLTTPIATPDGLFVASGLSAGQVVATRGASALFAAEQAGG